MQWSNWIESADWLAKPQAAESRDELESADEFWMVPHVRPTFRDSLRPAATASDCELIVNEEHFQRVIVDGIRAAKTSIDIMTADFKAMLVPEPMRRRARSIVEIFRELATRGVEIRLLHAGVPSSAALRELKLELPEGLVIRRCPRLHSKAIVIDANAMYLGSANLTGAGLGAKSATRRNFEMGIWTSSNAMIDAVMEEFNQLWEGRECKGCGRRDVCPVPLEEPAL